MILLAFGFVYATVIPIMRIPFVYARIYPPDFMKRDERELRALGSPDLVSRLKLQSYALENDNSVAAELARTAAESELRQHEWRHRTFGIAALALVEVLLTPKGAVNELLAAFTPETAFDAWWIFAAAAAWLLFLGVEPASSLDDDAIYWPANPINPRRRAVPVRRIADTPPVSHL
jgi:hypothetical protein